MPSILLFGGSFDPVHNGHLVTALRACEELGTDRVVFMPAAVSPHKMHAAGGGGATGAQRVEMLRRATAGLACFDVSDWEVLRPPPSYTIDTVEMLVAGGHDVTLLMGADQLRKFHQWRRVSDLLDIARVAVLGRPGSAMDIAERAGSALQKYLPKLRPLTTPLLEISATDVRARVRADKPIRYLVPDAVAAYIAENNLYRVG